MDNHGIVVKITSFFLFILYLYLYFTVYPSQTSRARLAHDNLGRMRFCIFFQLYRMMQAEAILKAFEEKRGKTKREKTVVGLNLRDNCACSVKNSKHFFRSASI